MQMKRLMVRTFGIAVLSLGLTGCQVEQQEPGRAPDVDLDVDAEAGRWPEYDVDWADVDVGMRERTVTVPVVRVVEEQREVSVPYLDINPPGARDREERTVTMELDAPHAGYRLEIAEVRAAGDNLWVIGRLMEDSSAASAQAITRVSDQVVINAPDDLDVRKIIVGPRPEGFFNRQYRFVDSMSALEQIVPSGARVVYQRTS